MSFRRVSAIAGALVLALSTAVPVDAQDKKPAPEQPQQQQRKLSNDERKEYIALSDLVDRRRALRADDARLHVREEIPFYTGRRIGADEIQEVLA